jgi:DNA modification methylase
MSNRNQKTNRVSLSKLVLGSTIYVGDCKKTLSKMPASSIDAVVTSPPYFRLRQYLPSGHASAAREIGHEPTVDEFVASIVAVFVEVHRVLKPTGTVWLNMGDVYGGYDKRGAPKIGEGIKTRDLCLLPYRVAIALQQAGWWLRSNIAWVKPEPGPENVRNRPTCAHEAVFLLTKQQADYHYDADAMREPYAPASLKRFKYFVSSDERGGLARAVKGGRKKLVPHPLGRHGRNVWTISTRTDAVRTAHTATMPLALAERCIKAGCRPGGIVLDPFAGSGTTGVAANRLGRDAVLIELNPEFAKIARKRLAAGHGMAGRYLRVKQSR